MSRKQIARRRRLVSGARSAQRSILVDALEPRRLFAASVALSPDGTLVVEGTEKADNVVISLQRKNAAQISVRVNRVTAVFDVASITSGILVRTLGGNDRVVVEERAGAVGLDLTVFAGGGNDFIRLGSGDDQVDAGVGNDNVTGGAGNDLLLGGTGNDLLAGGAGDDQISGDAGNDKCDGGAGDDQLEGDAGNDAVNGGAGDDEVFGGDGNDSVNGREGDDDVFGDAGKDVIDGGAGDDYLSGGDDRDNVRGGKGDDTFDNEDNSREQRDRGETDDVAPTFQTLPQAVKDRLSQTFGNATPAKVDAEDGRGDGVVTEYRFLVAVNGIPHEIGVGVDGTVLFHEAGDGDAPLTLASLPQAARDDFAAGFPGATLLGIGAEDGAGDGVITEYLLKFTLEGRFNAVRYDASGARLGLESQDDGPTTTDRLPAAVTAYLATNYPNAAIKSQDAEDSQGDGAVDRYAFRFIFEGHKYEVVLSPAGTLISVETNANDPHEHGPEGHGPGGSRDDGGPGQKG